MSKTPSTNESDGHAGEGGLLFRVDARMKGRMRWQVLDADGNPEWPVGPDGRPINYGGGWQDNLITDRGLNRVPVAHVFRPNSTSGETSGGWRNYLALGTGSTTPDVTDAALANEVQRGNTNGALNAVSYTLDTVNNVIRGRLVRDVQVTMSADRNLTEYGLSDEASVGVNIRELFRDDMGDPITISLLNGKTLRLQHQLDVEIPAPSAGATGEFTIHELDAANNPVGDTDYDIIYGPTGNVERALKVVWNPAETGIANHWAWRLTTNAYNRVTMVAGAGATGTDSQLVATTYVGDSFERVKRATIAAATANYNGEWRGIGFYGGIDGGFAFCFDDPATFTKVNTHTLRVGLISSWGRA